MRDGYDRCAAAYTAARQDELPELRHLTERLAPGSRVLDIGCGAGVPACRELVRRFDVTGVDISSVQIGLARRNVPEADFVCADIMDVDFESGSFEAITSFYTIFHLPREEHGELLGRIHRWLGRGGFLICTVGEDDEAPYTEDDFFGVMMYWSNFSCERYRRVLEQLGFGILSDRVMNSGFKDTPPESHRFVLARKE